MKNAKPINELIIGVDVSKDKLDLMILPLKRAEQIKNNVKTIRKYFKAVKKLGNVKLVVCESTGGYEQGLVQALTLESVPCHVAHPNRVFHFAKAKGYFAKTDALDAKMLAHYGEQAGIEANGVYDEKQAQLKQLSSRKQQLKMQISQEKNRLSQPYLTSWVKKSLNRSIKNLKQEVMLIQRDIQGLLESDNEKKERMELLKTFKGVGQEIAQTLVTDLPELGHLDKGAIASLVGVAPRNRDSGKKTGHRMITGGRGHIRQLCYMAALVSIRYNKPMMVFYERLRAKGKAAKVALIALARKILITLNAMVKNNTAWQVEGI